MKEVAYTVVMSADTSLVLKSIVGILAGLLIASGYLPSETKDAFINDASTVGGITLTIISLIYALEHALLKVKADLKVPGTTDAAVIAKTVTTTTIPSTATTEPSMTTVETPVPPTNG